MNDEELIDKGQLLAKTIIWWENEVNRVMNLLAEEESKDESELRDENIKTIKLQLAGLYVKGQKEIKGIEDLIREADEDQ